MGLDNPLHILLLLVVVLLVFGAKRLPEIGRSLGDGMRGFKDSLHGEVLHTVSLEHSPETVSAPLSTLAPSHVPTAPTAAHQPLDTGL
jgi:sec-independent protein translocase protein TatA